MRVLILGAGPAGMTAAQQLRELTAANPADVEITVVSAEPDSEPLLIARLPTLSVAPAIRLPPLICTDGSV